MTKTTYDSQRIQQEGRHIQIGKEAQVITSKHSQGERKTPEQKERQRLQKYEYRKQNREKIRLYNVKKHAAKKQLIEASKIANEKQKETVKAFKIYEQSQIAETRLHNNKKIFPDWSYLWIKEKSRRISNERYHNMSFTEKKEFNNKSQALRMARHRDNPNIARRYQDRINAWKKRNPEKARASAKLSLKKRKLIDPGFRVQCNLRSRLKELIGTAKRGGSSQINNLTGCSTQQLAKHLESQFKHGMSWDNYGVDGWHVDHIMPCASFDHTDHKQVKHCWHWSNLRPMWAKDNISKSDTITEPQLNLLLCSHH